MIIENLEPQNVFSIFKEFSAIPHGSYNIDAISDWVVDFAAKHGLYAVQDDDKNVVVRREASKGFESVPTIMLQGHLDMVCAKENDVEFDFTRDALDLYIDGDFLKARGTTLGADDGVFIAFALAILTDTSLNTGAIEAVFTVNEEVGLLGAASINPELMSGKYMINIDSPEESSIVVSCAGGQDADIILPVKKVSSNDKCYMLQVTGLKGGHSGEHINKGLANANIILTDTLHELSGTVNLKLVSVEGGVADNVIPSFASAIIQLNCTEYETVLESLSSINETLKERFNNTDDGINVSLIDIENEYEYVYDNKTTNTLISLIQTAPNGVVNMSPDIEGLVETSLNLGIISNNNDEIKLTYSLRSSIDEEKENLFSRLSAIALSHGALVKDMGSYPGWKFNKNSVLQKIFKKVYFDSYGKELRVEAIHAGLECGIFSGKIEGLDCVSMGPDVFDIHTCNERLSISSTQRSYEYLKNVLISFSEEMK